MLDARTENPRRPAARRAEDRVALCIELDGESVDERNRDAASHRRRSLRPDSVHPLQVALGSDSAEPARHDLLAANAVDVLLVDEATAVARLLDSRLYFDQSAGAAPAGGGDPVITQIGRAHV